METDNKLKEVQLSDRKGEVREDETPRPVDSLMDRARASAAQRVGQAVEGAVDISGEDLDNAFNF